MSSWDNRNNSQPEILHIDNLLSTQNELGPKIPDGGYGWVIMAASIFFQALVPSLSVGYGIFLMFSRIETVSTPEACIWDTNLVYAPFFFITTWTIADPWTRRLCTTSTWPRLVSTAGTCLICAGLLVVWIAINDGSTVGVFILAGILTGIGASIVLTQIDVLICQYFHLKLESVTSVLNATQAIGFIGAPLILGHSIVNHGILHVTTWWQAVILQGIIVSIAFKKPQYLKTQRSKYKLIRGLSDEEEDVFAKNATELQSTRRPQEDHRKIEATVESIPTTSSSTITETNPTNDLPINKDLSPKSLEQELKQAGWETFEDDQQTPAPASTISNQSLHRAFSDEFHQDLDRIDHVTEAPSSLFTESYINNNISYAYEGPVEVEEPVVFAPITKSDSGTNWRKHLGTLRHPTFYKSLLFHITIKFSIYTFWTFFPVFLYLRVEHLKVHHTTVVLACINIGGLVFSSFATWIKSNPNIRTVFLWIFCWMGGVGYLNSEKQTTLLFGAIDISLSISALQILGLPLMKLGLQGETSSAHMMLSTLTGLSFVVFLFINISYTSCFRLMALLQFLTGSLWLSNFIYKKIKKRISVT